MKNCLHISILLLLSGFCATAQNFSLDPDTIVSQKPADFFTFYLPAQFSNDSGGDLDLRWVKEILLEEYQAGHGGESFWDYSIQDPDNFYTDGSEVDSADFVLPEVPDAFDKFIVQVYPNMTAGHMVFAFQIYEIGNPDNSIQIIFDYTATPATSSPISEWQDEGLPRVFPNPAAETLNIANDSAQAWQFSLLSATGATLGQGDIPANGQKSIPLEGIPTGLYFLRMEAEGKVFFKKITVKQ